MELVKGIPITDYCDQRPAVDRASGWSCSSRSARRCSTPTRRGSSTATSSPRTSWSRCYDGVPVPKVIDFGVAKAIGPAAHRADAVHRLRAARRHAAVHEPRAGRAERAGRRHPQRHLLAGRAALRAADRHDAVRPGDASARRRSTRCRRIIREEEPPRPSTRLEHAGATADDRLGQPPDRPAQAGAS